MESSNECKCCKCRRSDRYAELEKSINTVLETDDWALFAHKKHGLKITDISDMKPGDKVRVLILDRNVWDVAMRDKSKQNKIYKPADFFKDNFGTYTHEHDLSGQMIFHWEGNENFLDENFEFHVEYKDYNWYPLHSGYLPKEDNQGIFGDFGFGKDMFWTEFPNTTGIGYRGPMILESKLELLPDIIWKQIDLTSDSE